MYLHIERFKCFVDADIQINQLTVLAGCNGNGKSTFIQALLYLRQTVEQNSLLQSDRRYILKEMFRKQVSLNGEYCLALGNSYSIINRNSSSSISLGIHVDDSELLITYHADVIEPKLWLEPVQFDMIECQDLPIFTYEFYYLNAERIGPRIRQDLQNMEYPHAGWQGQFIGQLLARDNGYWKILDERKFRQDGGEPEGSSYLMDQTNLWLEYLMPGVKVKVKIDPETLSAQILLENPYTISEPTLATNLGFGISYVLPIIVNGLVAEKNSFFIVENPEAHLHPSAQSKVARFLAVIANTGVNVVVETHSDHFINGLQLSVVENKIPANAITINYFQSDQEIQPSVTPITISERGELSVWPSGFFDQTQIDFAHLLNLRKNA